MLPRITELEINDLAITEDKVTHKCFMWDFESGDFALKDGKLIELEGLPYIQIWIEKALKTKAWTLIYEKYGSEHHSLIGRVFDRDFVRAELERTIKEALLENSAITSVHSFEFEFDGTLLNIKFKVSTIYGDSEVVING